MFTCIINDSNLKWSEQERTSFKDFNGLSDDLISMNHVLQGFWSFFIHIKAYRNVFQATEGNIKNVVVSCTPI